MTAEDQLQALSVERDRLAAELKHIEKLLWACKLQLRRRPDGEIYLEKTL